MSQVTHPCSGPKRAERAITKILGFPTLQLLHSLAFFLFCFVLFFVFLFCNFSASLLSIVYDDLSMAHSRGVRIYSLSLWTHVATSGNSNACTKLVFSNHFPSHGKNHHLYVFCRIVLILLLTYCYWLLLMTLSLLSRITKVFLFITTKTNVTSSMKTS